jgi:hypothetical protein
VPSAAGQAQAVSLPFTWPARRSRTVGRPAAAMTARGRDAMASVTPLELRSLTVPWRSTELAACALSTGPT